MNKLHTIICRMTKMTTKAIDFVVKNDTITALCTNTGVYASGDDEGTCCGGSCGCDKESCGC